MEFSPHERRLIAELDQNLSTRVNVRRIESPDDRSVKFRDFCEALTRTATKIEVTVVAGDDGVKPALEIPAGLTFHAVPSGPELAPFAEAVAALDPAFHHEPAAELNRLASIVTRSDIKIFIAPFCRFCPDVVRALSPFPRVSGLVKVSVIDGLLFPELAAPYDIKSAPTIIVDDRGRWTGQPDLAQIIEVLTEADPASWNISVFETMIREGNAPRIAEITLSAGAIPGALPDLLAHDSLSIRLGALVALEEISSADPGLAAQLVEPLWRRFPGAESAAQGDILYALGEIGSRETVESLKTVLDGPYEPAVKEAAQEALEKLESL